MPLIAILTTNLFPADRRDERTMGTAHPDTVKKMLEEELQKA